MALIGVNGVGRTTLADKLAARAVMEHATAVAADTFRPAAGATLGPAARGRAGAANAGADPAAVAHDGVSAIGAAPGGAEMDTAAAPYQAQPDGGLEKVARVAVAVGRPITFARPDATVGQNGVAPRRASSAAVRYQPAEQSTARRAVGRCWRSPISSAAVSVIGGRGLDDWDPAAFARGLFE